MDDRLNDIIARLRAEARQEDYGEPQLNVAAEDLNMLLQALEILEREKEELRRKTQKQDEIMEAVEVFMAAYRDKYKNYSSPGMRPSAVLRREVTMICAAMKDLQVASDTSF